MWHAGEFRERLHISYISYLIPGIVFPSLTIFLLPTQCFYSTHRTRKNLTGISRIIH